MCLLSIARALFVLSVLCGFSVPVAAAAASDVAPIHWERRECPGGSPPGDATLLFRCGADVSYHSAPAGREAPLPGGCQITSGAAESPAVYPGSDVFTKIDGDYPCSDSACFCEFEACELDGQPWVAVIDRDNWHGRSQAGLIAEMVGPTQHVALLDLEAALAETALDGLGAVTDLNVLARLCQLIDIGEAEGAPVMPSVVSMSFGRVASCADSSDAGESGGTASNPRSREPGSTLAGEISWALEELREVHGVIPLAAHGNHGSALFPASDASVLAVGALDLSAYRAPGFEIAASWETPAGANALFPGNGVCLPFDDSLGDGYWRSPAGSSQANALAAGWVADAVAGGWFSVDHLAGASLLYPFPGDLRTPADFALAKGGTLIPGTWSTPASELIGRLLDPRHACWQEDDLPRAVFASPGPMVDLVSVLPSPEQLACEEHVQTPDTDYCIPCLGAGGIGKDRAGVITTLQIDLSAPAVRNSNVTVNSLALRVGEEQRLLELADGTLADLGLGVVDILTLTNVDIRLGDEVSLIWEMEWNGLSFWTSSPVHLP